MALSKQIFLLISLQPHINDADDTFHITLDFENKQGHSSALPGLFALYRLKMSR